LETTLNFCTRCGTRVNPYAPSTSSYYDSGEQQAPGGVDRHYWCPNCREKWVATNLVDTGWACAGCKNVMPVRNNFCGICGRRAGPTRNNAFDTRLFRLYKPSGDLREISAQLQDLRAVLFSAIQDIAVLRKMLEAKGVWNETEYKTLRVDQMLRDHSSAGSEPWVNYSFYPFTLDEEEFLRQRLAATESEVTWFKTEVDGRMTQT